MAGGKRRGSDGGDKGCGKRRGWKAVLIGAAVGVAAAIGGLVGCGPVDKPEAEVAAFNGRFGDDPAVESISLSGTNDGIPFAAGTVSGQVTLVQGLDDGQVTDIVRRLGDYIDDPEVGAGFSAPNLEVDGIRMRLFSSEDRRDTQVDLVLGLRQDDEVSSAEIYAPGADSRSRLRISTPSQESIPGLNERWTGPVEALSVTDSDPNILDITVTEGEFAVRGGIAEWRQPMLEAWRELAGRFTVTSFELREHSVEIRIAGDGAEEAEVTEAMEAAREALEAHAPDGMEIIVETTEGE